MNDVYVSGTWIESVEVKKECSDWAYKTFEDKESYEVCKSDSERPTMPEEQPSQMSEFTDGVVSKGSCLVSFFSIDSHSNMCLLYHIDVVGSISNGQSNCTLNHRFEELDSLSFLTWWASVNYYSFNMLECLS